MNKNFELISCFYSILCFMLHILTFFPVIVNLKFLNMFRKMLFTRRFYFQLFHFHNNKLSSGMLIRWRNLPHIFGSQFSHILNINVIYNILYKYQQFCLRNQFCTVNNDSVHPLSSAQNTNFSTISSFENQTNISIKQKEQQQCLEEAKKSFNREHLTLETRFLELDDKKQLKITLQKGKSCQKYFNITLSKDYHIANFRNILVPGDAYAFVRALGELIEKLAAEDFEQKLHIQDSQSNIEIIVNDDRQQMQVSQLDCIELNGQNHKYQLELLLFRNITKMNGQIQQIFLRLYALNKIVDYECRMNLPLKTLPWLRKQMIEMLAKHDGTEKIENETSAKISQQFFNLDALFALPSPNGISPIQKFQQKEMQPPQFINKKPTSFQQHSKMPIKMQNSNQNEGTEKCVDDQLDLEVRFLVLDNSKKQLQLKLQKGRSGQKFFDIKQLSKDFNFTNFHNIMVPEDAYAFVRALDVLILELAAENFEQKLRIQDPQSTIEFTNNGRQTIRALKLKTVELIGLRHKFQLELLLFINTRKAEIDKGICLGLFTVNKIKNNKSQMILPLKALPWLRTQIAEILTKHDGTEEIAKEASAQIPQQFFARNLSRTPTFRNGIYSGHKLEHRVMQSQFVNNKPTSFQQYTKMPTKMQNFNQSGYKKQKMFFTPLSIQQIPNFKRPKMADLEESTDFDFDDDEMKKYRIGG